MAGLRIIQVATSDSSIYLLLLDQIKALQNMGHHVTAVCSPGPWAAFVKILTISFVIYWIGSMIRMPNLVLSVLLKVVLLAGGGWIILRLNAIRLGLRNLCWSTINNLNQKQRIE